MGVKDACIESIGGIEYDGAMITDILETIKHWSEHHVNPEAYRLFNNDGTPCTQTAQLATMIKHRLTAQTSFQEDKLAR